jgi:hypothetical protein
LAEEEGAKAGFHFSRLGGGDRLSTFQPAGADQVVEGYNGEWDLGAGLNANRQSLSSNSGIWPNVIRFVRAGGGPVMSGETVDLDLYYQAGASAVGDVALTLMLDVDANPWNGNEIQIDGGVLPKTGTTGMTAVGLVPIAIDPGMTPPGMYRVGARLTDGAKSRVLYAVEMVEVLEATPPEIDLETMRLEGGLLTFSVTGVEGQMVEIEASDDLREWETVGMTTLGGEDWVFSDLDTALYHERFYRLAY